VQEGCEQASFLWQEISQQGFSSGYKVVNTRQREYLGKPGRRSSEREQANKHALWDAVRMRDDLYSREEDTKTPPATSVEQEGPLVEPLGSPGHLTWLLLRAPERLNQQDHVMLAFMREVHDIDVTYQLAQRFFTMVRKRYPDQFDLWLPDCLHSEIPDLQTFATGLRKRIRFDKSGLDSSIQQWARRRPCE
jgi:hypothetical protein